MLARDDEAPVVGVVEIDIELGDQSMAAGRVHAFVLRIDHAEDWRLEHVGRVADGVGDLGVAGGHAVERAVRLYVVERHTLGFEEALERADLVDETIGELIASNLHFSPPKPLTVRQRWMRSDFNVVLLGELHRRAHVIEVGGVEATCDIGDVDRGHDALVVAEAPDAETLAHVAIQEGHQRLRHGRVHKVTKTGANVKSEILALRA